MYLEFGFVGVTSSYCCNFQNYSETLFCCLLWTTHIAKLCKISCHIFSSLYFDLNVNRFFFLLKKKRKNWKELILGDWSIALSLCLFHLIKCWSTNFMVVPTALQVMQLFKSFILLERSYVDWSFMQVNHVAAVHKL